MGKVSTYVEHRMAPTWHGLNKKTTKQFRAVNAFKFKFIPFSNSDYIQLTNISPSSLRIPVQKAIASHHRTAYARIKTPFSLKHPRPLLLNPPRPKRKEK